MKPILLCLFLSYCISGYSQTKDLFVRKIIDLGNVSSAKRIIEAEFDFCNETKNIIVIQKVRTSCGCTTVKYPTNPLRIKQKGKIEVTLNIESINGYFQKNIMVWFSGLSPVLLKIKGDVCKSESKFIK